MPSSARLLRLLLTGFAGASIAFVPSWVRILDGTWPAWALAAHAVVLTGLAVAVGKRQPFGRAAIGLSLFAVVVPTAFLIGLRFSTGPALYIHDSAVQTEEAMRYVLEGKDPYVESYAGTPMADMHFFGGKNPALEHVVYYPGSFLLSLPGYAAWKALGLRYDHRYFLLLCFAATLWGAWRLGDDGWRPHLLVSAGLNPAFDFYLIQGANDVVVSGLLFPALALARSGGALVPALLIGAACATKQTAWFFAVLYAADVMGRLGVPKAAAAATVIGASMLSLTLPYVLWDKAAFFDDTYFYLAGTSKESYPIAGISIANLVSKFDVSPAVTRRLFTALQLGVVLPVLLGCALSQYRSPGPSGLALRYSLVVATAFVCSRYFNASHLAFVSHFFVAGWFMPAPQPPEELPRAGSNLGTRPDR